MSRVTAAVCVLALSVAAGAAAQQSETPRPPADAAKPRAGAPAEQAAAPRPPEGQGVNIKFDLTITDQTGTAEAAKKTVSLLVLDRQTGYVRSTSSSERTGQVRINVDARPQILSTGNIRVTLSLEYQAISQQITVVVESGKPLIVTQTADPLSERKVTVEMRATILK
jgi:glucose/arabinose dehydrogenase